MASYTEISTLPSLAPSPRLHQSAIQPRMEQLAGTAF